MDDFALTSAERALLLALGRRGVRYIVVGLGAAVLQGESPALPLERSDDPLDRDVAGGALDVRTGGQHLPAAAPLEIAVKLFVER